MTVVFHYDHLCPVASFDGDEVLSVEVDISAEDLIVAFTRFIRVSDPEDLGPDLSSAFTKWNKLRPKDKRIGITTLRNCPDWHNVTEAWDARFKNPKGKAPPPSKRRKVG